MTIGRTMPDPENSGARNEIYRDIGRLAFRKKLNDLLLLQGGWDGGNAIAIQEGACDFAAKIIEECMKRSCREPDIVPLSSGGIQLEWFVGDHEIEVEIHGSERASILYERVSSGKIQEIEIDGMKDIAKIANIVRNI